MRKRRIFWLALLVIALLAGTYTAVSAAAGSSDPLVTLSYLTGKFTPQMKNEMQKLVNDKEAELTNRFDQAVRNAGGGTNSGGSVFSVVTLSKGQKLTGDVGCEIMLRVGSAVCSSGGATGLIDATDGTTLSEGKALVTNHLYLVTISTRSVTAGANTVRLLVRGPYTIS